MNINLMAIQQEFQLAEQEQRKARLYPILIDFKAVVFSTLDEQDKEIMISFAEKVKQLSEEKLAYYKSRFGFIEQFFSSLYNRITLGVWSSTGELGLELANQVLKEKEQFFDSIEEVDEIFEDPLESDKTPREQLDALWERSDEVLQSEIRLFFDAFFQAAECISFKRENDICTIGTGTALLGSYGRFPGRILLDKEIVFRLERSSEQNHTIEFISGLRHETAFSTSRLLKLNMYLSDIPRVAAVGEVRNRFGAIPVNHDRSIKSLTRRFSAIQWTKN